MIQQRKDTFCVFLLAGKDINYLEKEESLKTSSASSSSLSDLFILSILSLVTKFSAISRSAITVGLSLFSGTKGSEPNTIWRARLLASSTNSSRFL